jgi:hypothetical protein
VTAFVIERFRCPIFAPAGLPGTQLLQAAQVFVLVWKNTVAPGFSQRLAKAIHHSVRCFMLACAPGHEQGMHGPDTLMADLSLSVPAN